MSTTALEIACAKPDCHWKGSPADAPAHLCPTSVGDPFAGMLDSDGLPLADSLADRTLPFWVVWQDAGDLRILGTRTTEADAVTLASEVTASKPARGEVIVKPSPIGPAEDLPEPPIAADAEPESREELEAWLLEHGTYDDAGIPQDEKTARLDARLSGYLTGETEDEPALEELEPIEEPDLLGGEPAPAGEPEAKLELAGVAETVPVDGPRPWEIVVADALTTQTAVKEYRWLVVWHPEDEAREAELIGRAKVKNEAVVIAEDVEHRGQLRGRIETVKTADVLARAEELTAEIERKRTLVDPEPEVVVETPLPPAEEPKPETTEKPAETAPATPGGKPALFDASAFEREDLALPKVDGHPIDRIAIAFSGEIMLDRSNPDHVALWRRMKVGRELEVWATVKGTGFAGNGATNREGDLDVMVGKRSVKVTMLRVIPPEGLEDAARELAAQARDAHDAGEDGLEDGPE